MCIPILVILVRFKLNFKLFDRLLKNNEIPNFMKVRPAIAELFHAERRTDRQTSLKKLIAAFHNPAKAQKQNYNYM
jgi:ribosomal protein L39E